MESTLSGAEKNGPDVTIEQILCHILPDDFPRVFEHLEVLVSHFGSNFVSDMKQLPEM